MTLPASYDAWRLEGPPESDAIGMDAGDLCNRVCRVEGCISTIRSKGLCSKHYARFRTRGSTELRTERTMKIRGVRVEGVVAYVTLTKGYEAIIDAADAVMVGKYNWHARVQKRTVYAARNSRSSDGSPLQCIMLHRAIMRPPDHMQVDHISGDGLDCRRSNLRLATPTQNCRNARKRLDNKSGFKGVSWHSQRKKWVSQISDGSRRLHLGLFETPEEAHEAYKRRSLDFHKEFGRSE